MPDGAQPTTGPSGGQRPVLGFPVRPGGDGATVAGGRHHWYELAQEIHGAFADIDRAVASMQWSGDGRRAFDAAWSQLSGHGTEAAQHSQEMGDHLLTLGHQIDDAQHQWDMAMTAMAASTAIGIGLTFVTFGISDAVAEGAAAAAVGTMEAICTALDIYVEAALQVMMAAIRTGVQLAVKFTWQFGISVVTQETANVVQGQGLDHVNLLQAAEFAAATLIPGLGGKVTIGGKPLLEGASGALVSGALTDTAIQGMEAVTEGRPFSPGEVVASGMLAMGGQALAGAVGSRLGRSGAELDQEAAHARYEKLLQQIPDVTKLDALIAQIGDAAKLERLLQVFRATELETMLAQLKDGGSLVVVLDHVGPATCTGMIRDWMANGEFAEMNQFVERLAGGAGKELAEKAALGGKSLVIDSNTAIALINDADPTLRGTMNRGEQARVAYINSVPGDTDLRVGNVTVGEIPGGVLDVRGVPIEVARESAEYQKVLGALAKANVGKAQGFADRGLIADAFFAKTEAGVVPRFLTGDKNVVNALARMAEIDVNAIGGFRTILKTY
jgi:hypothetical protein